MANAIIPRDERISMCTSVPVEGPNESERGVTLTLATAKTYFDFEREGRPWNFEKHLESVSMMRWVKHHGIAISQEIFDTVRLGVPFKLNELVGELMTINHLAPPTQRCYIDATLRWLSIQDELQVHRHIGRMWII